MSSSYIEIIRPDSSIGIVDADLLDNGTRHPNLALMKISSYCKSKGCYVELLTNYDNFDKYDQVFISRVFTFTEVPEWLMETDRVHLGGTGFFMDGGEPLPDEIEHSFPDYDLYKEYVEKQIAAGRKRSWFADYLDYSIGFTSRGCFRKCSFCVNKKYDKALAHSPISEFLDESRPMIYLWDDNFMAFSGWEKVLDELIATGKPFQFRQGLDVRLLNDKRAAKLARVNYCGDFIFAFDHIEDRELIEEKLTVWRRHTDRGTRLYVLCAYDSQDEKDIENTLERIKILMHYGCLPYIMRYESYKQSRWRSLYVNFARWCNQPQFFKKKSFRDFCETNQRYHKNKETKCSAYRSMTEFEEEFPEIAKRYFDLRYEDENTMNRLGRLFAASFSEEVNQVLNDAWKSFAEGQDALETLKAYFSKKLDIVWLEKNEPDRCEELASRLFGILLAAPLSLCYQAILEGEGDYHVTPKNIPQFSSLGDVAKTAYYLNGLDEFLTFDSLGIYLQPEKTKNATANKKYGENHGKVASLLDIASIEKADAHKGFGKTLFSAPFSKLSEDRQLSMMARLAFRIPIIQAVLKKASSGPAFIADEMISLSESTQVRRMPNVAALLELIQDRLSKGDDDLREALARVERYES